MPDERNKRRSQYALLADMELWHEVTRSVKPMHPKPIAKIKNTALQAEFEAELNPTKSIKKPSLQKDSPAANIVKISRGWQPVIPNQHKPLSGLDRRASQRLGRGQVNLDSRIDLHGETLATARPKLLGFLTAACARGDRLVLVITGKGASPYARHTLHGVDYFHAPERGGMIRRSFTEWLDEKVFRDLVSGWQPAHPKHGGGGAFYVKLRRKHKIDRL